MSPAWLNKELTRFLLGASKERRHRYSVLPLFFFILLILFVLVLTNCEHKESTLYFKFEYNMSKQWSRKTLG